MCGCSVRCDRTCEETLVNRCLARMGYKQELRRQYSTRQVFAVAFSIMGLVPSIASTLSFSLPAGPVGMIWVCDRLISPCTSR